MTTLLNQLKRIYFFSAFSIAGIFLLFIPSEGISRSLEEGIYLEIFDRNRIIEIQVEETYPPPGFIYQNSSDGNENQMIATLSRREPTPPSRHHPAPSSPNNPAVPPGIFPGLLIKIPPPKSHEKPPPTDYHPPSSSPPQSSPLKPNKPIDPVKKSKPASPSTKSKDQRSSITPSSIPDIPLDWIIPSLLFGLIGGYLLRKIFFKTNPMVPVVFLHPDGGSPKVEPLTSGLSNIEVRLKPVIDPGRQDILSINFLTMDEGEKK